MGFPRHLGHTLTLPEPPQSEQSGPEYVAPRSTLLGAPKPLQLGQVWVSGANGQASYRLWTRSRT